MKQFTVICRKEDYDEVAQILEGWGYERYGEVWESHENCVTTNANGLYMTFINRKIAPTEPRYTLAELREMSNPNT